MLRMSSRLCRQGSLVAAARKVAGAHAPTSSSGVVASLVARGVSTGARAAGSCGSDEGTGGHWASVAAWACAALGCVGVAWATHRPAESCGIVGVVGGEDAVGFLLEGLTILRNRGYDSAGIASIASDGQGQLTVTKYASQNSTADSIDLVRAHSGKHLGHSTGIGHTRWATHGGKTDQVTGARVLKSPPGQTLVSSPTTHRTTPLISPLLALGTSGQNAHPHSDAKGRVAVIHNGTINNSYDLKKELMAAGVKFQSETDTEVISFRPAFITTTVQYCHLASALGQTPVLWPPSLRPHLNPLCPISHLTPVACR